MTDALRAKRLGVARGMGIGLGVTIAVVIVWAMRGEAASLEARLVTTAASVAVLGAWLAISVGNVARMRFFSAAAIDAGSGGTDGDHAVTRARAVLQNTLEQAVLAAFVYLALALVQDRARTLIAALAALFSTGRVLFWAGYADGAAARALGFALTFYPSIAGLMVVLATLAGV